MSAPGLKQVMRLDSIPLDNTYWTDEGYLVDHPIVTSCGIFEYVQKDGSVQRELRLPENVFDEESLVSYEGKPIIITHEAGRIDKDNVEDEQIGTILSCGYQDGDDVRAKIVIHNTDALRCGLRELSLGYNLSLDETPGVWNGQPYDAIQKDIRINHLALVANARAGEQARLNIDGKDEEETLKGGKVMAKPKKKRTDGADLTPEQVQEAIAAYISNHQTGQVDAEESGVVVAETDMATESANNSSDKDKVNMVKDRRDSRRDQEGTPATTEEAQAVIAQQDEDIDTLLAVIEAMEAKQDFDEADDEVKGDEEGEEKTDEEEKNPAGTMNADSIDRIVRTRVALARIGDSLHLDGLENMSILDAKKAIIRKVKPKMRLDGKSKAYIDAAFDLAAEEATARKDTDFQRRQIFNADGYARTANAGGSGKTSAEKAREKMISKRMGGNE